jgi:hypothetical protein
MQITAVTQLLQPFLQQSLRSLTQPLRVHSPFLLQVNTATDKSRGGERERGGKRRRRREKR